MLNNYFKEIYVITTQGSDRVSYIKKHLEENNINFKFWVSPNFEIIDDRFRSLVHPTVSNQRYMSLTSAASSIIEMARISNFENVCILEDDCFFTPNWKIEFENFMATVPTNWNILNLGFLDNSRHLININSYVNQIVGQYWGCQCVVFNKNIFDHFLSIYNSNKGNIPYDWITREIYSIKLYKSYTPIKKIIRQLSVVDGLSYNQDVESSIKFKSKIGATK